MLACWLYGCACVWLMGWSSGLFATKSRGYPTRKQSACVVDLECGIHPPVILAMTNSKGGVGKSSMAGHLAGWLYANQRTVILVDCDAQCSSSEWIIEAAPSIQVVRLSNADEVLDELPSLAQEAEFVICDGPGSQTETSRALLMWADIAIIPTKASMFESRALAKNTAFVRQAQAIRKGPPHAIVVLSMVGKDYRLTKDMREAAIGLQLSVAKNAITLRQAIADCPGQGKFCWELGFHARDAAREMDALFREILPDVANDDFLTATKNRRHSQKQIHQLGGI